MEAIVRKWGNDFGVRIPLNVARKMSLSTGYRVLITPIEQKPVKPEKTAKVKVAKKKSTMVKKLSKNDLKLPKQVAELYGILKGVYAPDKKEIRKEMYKRYENNC